MVGWRDGGNTGLSLALSHPQQANKLVAMGATPWADTLATFNAALPAFLGSPMARDKKQKGKPIGLPFHVSILIATYFTVRRRA